MGIHYTDHRPYETEKDRPPSRTEGELAKLLEMVQEEVFAVTALVVSNLPQNPPSGTPQGNSTTG